MMTISNDIVETCWRGVLVTLAQRKTLQRRSDDTPIIPHTMGIDTSDRVIFVLDMHRLGNIPREKWLDDRFIKQLRATLSGRRVVVVDSVGLAIVVAKDPTPRQVQRLGRNILLDLTTRPVGEDTRIPIGMSRQAPTWTSLADLDSVLVSGTRRMGKSTWLNSMLYALLSKHTPEELQIVLVDPKAVEFLPWSGVPHGGPQSGRVPALERSASPDGPTGHRGRDHRPGLAGPLRRNQSAAGPLRPGGCAQTCRLQYEGREAVADHPPGRGRSG
jgi:hypothetical protein